jgi:hypothetical protein
LWQIASQHGGNPTSTGSVVEKSRIVKIVLLFELFSQGNIFIVIVIGGGVFLGGMLL